MSNVCPCQFSIQDATIINKKFTREEVEFFDQPSYYWLLFNNSFFICIPLIFKIPPKEQTYSYILFHLISTNLFYVLFLPIVQHKWESLKEGVQGHIGSLNWGYRVSLNDKNVKYINGFAEFVDEHTIEVRLKILQNGVISHIPSI